MPSPEQNNKPESGPSNTVYGLSEDSQFSAACHQYCPGSIDNILADTGVRIAANLCMKDVSMGYSGNEYIIDIPVECRGPRKALLSTTVRCGARLLQPAVVKLSLP